MILVWRALERSLIACVNDDLKAGELLPRSEVLDFLGGFCSKLLSFGGKYVVFPFQEFDLVALIVGGALLPPMRIKLMHGRENECHANSARRWQRTKKMTKIVTGFALTASGGKWRRHSWLLHKDGYIIETTVERDLYYGVTLDDVQAAQFVAENL